MTFFTSLIGHAEALRAHLGEGVEGSGLVAAAAALSDDAVHSVLTEATALVKAVELVQIAVSGVAAECSSRERGHSGFAQERGHRNTVSLLQEVTGSSKAEAAKHVRLGEALLEEARATDAAAQPSGDVGASGDVDRAAAGGESTREKRAPWHAPLNAALATGLLRSEQHDAIFRGLGAPPQIDAVIGTEPLADASELIEHDPSLQDSERAAANEAFTEAWALAAEQLIAEAQLRTVEELRRAARCVRDQLDPEGAEKRYLERFEKRSFRYWVDEHGQHRVSMSLTDDDALWVSAALDAALRPRRGGPRFVDPEEKARAAELADDPRSNEQLAYDLMIDIVRAGMLAEPEQVFGTRQAGVRLLITDAAQAPVASVDTAASVGHAEDDGTTLPAWLVSQHACTTGATPVAVDPSGNPLYVGREQRLFTPKQRIALAVRDGGCRWRGCDVPASYCEAHHVDEFARDQGRTDIDRGILLCRFHHMQLHHGGWRITRAGPTAEFLLHPTGDESPIPLPTRIARRYAWGELGPPIRRFRLAA